MKIILILLDGIGDRSYPILNHRTPLEAANTPNMNRLAAMGGCGLFHASSPGECLPSEMAHYLLFGYDRKTFPGRGLLEAVGERVAFDDSDVLCLSHFSGVRWKNGIPILEKGRDDILGTQNELAKLYQAVAFYEIGGFCFQLNHTRRNDGIIVISPNASPDGSTAASPHISDSDPITIGKHIGRIMPVSGNPEPGVAAKTADALNKYLSYCHQHLTDEDRLSGIANFLVTQRCGRRIVQLPFSELWGLDAMMIATGSVYGGLAHELGFDFVKVVDSSDPGQDLKERIQLALDDTKHDFFHVHTKVPDETSHKQGPVQKKEAIENLDAGMAELIDALLTKKDIMVIVTGDHSTPCESSLIHSGETVPVVMAGPMIRRDQVKQFDEVSAATGCLGLLRGRELMQMALNFTDCSVLETHQLGDTVKTHVPDDYPPFELK